MNRSANHERDNEITRRDFVATLLAGCAAPFFTGSIAGAFGETIKTSQDTARVQLKAQRLSWAGVKLELPSITLFIDPLINPQVWGDALKHIRCGTARGGRLEDNTARLTQPFCPSTARSSPGANPRATFQRCSHRSKLLQPESCWEQNL